MRISEIEFKYGIFLAPMAGITDRIFRSICREYGAELVYTGMVSAKALYYGDRKTDAMTAVSFDERPAAVQIFGSEPEMIGYAARILSERKEVDLIDLNMGCPVKKIVSNDEGAALIRDIRLSGEIIRQAVRNSAKPVTVKTRTGWDNENEVLGFSEMAEAAGAAAITVHGRTALQMYRGKADWDIIKKVKERLRIPVIGNGDIFSADDAVRLHEYSGADGIMIGRGALGNPWIFREAAAAYEEKGHSGPDREEMLRTILKQFVSMIGEYGRKTAALRMRKHLSWYVKGMDGCCEFKKRIFSVTDTDEMTDMIKEFFCRERNEA